MPTGTWPDLILKGKNKGQPHPAKGLDKQKYKADGSLRKARKSRALDPNRFQGTALSKEVKPYANNQPQDGPLKAGFSIKDADTAGAGVALGDSGKVLVAPEGIDTRAGYTRKRAPRGSVDARKKGGAYYVDRYGHAAKIYTGMASHAEYDPEDSTLLDANYGSIVNYHLRGKQMLEDAKLQRKAIEAKEFSKGAPAPQTNLKMTYQRTKLLDSFSPDLDINAIAEDGAFDYTTLQYEDPYPDNQAGPAEPIGRSRTNEISGGSIAELKASQTRNQIAPKRVPVGGGRAPALTGYGKGKSRRQVKNEERGDSDSDEEYGNSRILKSDYLLRRDKFDERQILDEELKDGTISVQDYMKILRENEDAERAEGSLPMGYHGRDGWGGTYGNLGPFERRADYDQSLKPKPPSQIKLQDPNFVPPEPIKVKGISDEIIEDSDEDLPPIDTPAPAPAPAKKKKKFKIKKKPAPEPEPPMTEEDQLQDADQSLLKTYRDSGLITEKSGYLKGYVYPDAKDNRFSTFDDALQAFIEADSNGLEPGGITLEPFRGKPTYSLRKGTSPLKSDKSTSYFIG